MYPKIILKPGKEESLKRFHPWVFSGAIARTEPRPGSKEAIKEGDTVQVVSSTGEVLGVGHAQIGGIAVRILSFKDETVNGEFYQNRIAQALQLRRELNLLRKDNNCFRLIHGEGDFLPGLVIDVYGDTAVMQAHSVGMHVERETVAAALGAVCKDFIKYIYYKSEGTLPHNAQLDVRDGYIGPKPARKARPVAVENGLQFYPDWLEGQKTGFFVDQRENRALVEKYAKGKRVLNMFCYTGGFSLYALRGGAKLVHSVDASAKAIELVNQNVELNFGGAVKPGAAKTTAKTTAKFAPKHAAVIADAFDYLNTTEKKYDLIILDPPAFAKHQNVLKQALQGYRKLNEQAFRNIEPGGLLFTFSCSQAVGKDDFRKAVFTAAARSGRKVRILHQLTQPADHPVNIYHPEGEYLKGLVLYVE